jgi:hypothetical protein
MGRTHPAAADTMRAVLVVLYALLLLLMPARPLQAM